MRGKGKRVDSSFQSANLYIIPTYTRVYINKETRVAKFPALSRVIKFKHRAQGWGDGFCREGMERGAWWSPRETSRPARCACAHGVSRTNRTRSRVSTSKQENILAKKLHLLTLGISSFSSTNPFIIILSILQTLYLILNFLQLEPRYK